MIVVIKIKALIEIFEYFLHEMFCQILFIVKYHVLTYHFVTTNYTVCREIFTVEYFHKRPILEYS